MEYRDVVALGVYFIEFDTVWYEQGLIQCVNCTGASYS
jgi:hypothetical protein